MHAYMTEGNATMEKSTRRVQRSELSLNKLALLKIVFYRVGWQRQLNLAPADHPR